jgi:hypothetical protein
MPPDEPNHSDWLIKVHRFLLYQSLLESIVSCAYLQIPNYCKVQRFCEPGIVNPTLLGCNAKGL